jgi:hypothetical protein
MSLGQRASSALHSKGLIMQARKVGLRVVVSIAFALAGLLLAAASNAQTLKEKVIGTWLPVSQYVDQDGKKVQPFGDQPKGMLVYDANGRFSLVLLHGSLPKFISNNRMMGTPEENKAVVQGSIAYYGRYTVNEQEGKIYLQVEGSSYPNWDTEKQVRLVSVVGDEMKTVNPVSAVGGGVVHFDLKRAK